MPSKVERVALAATALEESIASLEMRLRSSVIPSGMADGLREGFDLIRSSVVDLRAAVAILQDAAGPASAQAQAKPKKRKRR